MSLSKARANEVERTSTTHDIVLSRLPATFPRKARRGTKYMNSDKAQIKEPELTT